MNAKGIINIKSLKEQVYDYLRIQLQRGNILPGSVINMEITSKELGISKTPMRDALLQLEMEGFVTILPRRGVIVNTLEVEDIKNYFQVIGALESIAIIASEESFKPADLERMRKLSVEMKKAIKKGNFNSYYDKNLKFHGIFLELCGNPILSRTVDNLKKRLYDFPRPKEYVQEWEELLLKEHEELIELISKKNFSGAADYMRDVHWSFKVQEKFVRAYYRLEIEKKQKKI